MDYIWTPWRYQYIKDANRRDSCVFCDIAASNDDAANLIVQRAQSNFIVLNRFPYTNGHAMVIPYQHVATLEEAPAEVLAEMMTLTRSLESALRKVYRPSGINIGMNIGESAGAGVAGHIHMHVLPRWVADSSFITSIGETRVLPEDLSVTWERLRSALETTDTHQ
jgi:ATP adenylyltransferase